MTTQTMLKEILEELKSLKEENEALRAQLEELIADQKANFALLQTKKTTNRGGGASKTRTTAKLVNGKKKYHNYMVYAKDKYKNNPDSILQHVDAEAKEKLENYIESASDSYKKKDETGKRIEEAKMLWGYISEDTKKGLKELFEQYKSDQEKEELEDAKVESPKDEDSEKEEIEEKAVKLTGGRARRGAKKSINEF